MVRAVSWLVGGLGVLVLLVVAIAPELLGDLRAAGSVLGLALVALVPAVLLAAIVVSSRRRRGVPRPTAAPPAQTDDPGA